MRKVVMGEWLHNSNWVMSWYMLHALLIHLWVIVMVVIVSSACSWVHVHLVVMLVMVELRGRVGALLVWDAAWTCTAAAVVAMWVVVPGASIHH